MRSPWMRSMAVVKGLATRLIQPQGLQAAEGDNGPQPMAQRRRSSSRFRGLAWGQLPHWGLAPALSSMRPSSRRASTGIGPVAAPPAHFAMASSVLSPFCRPIAPEGAFCKPEEDPFLLLESSLRCIERILLFSEGQPLRRTWIEHPYGEEEITLLEEEVLPALQHGLQRVNEIDAALQEEQDARIANAQLQEIQEAERLLAQAEADQPAVLSR